MNCTQNLSSSQHLRARKGKVTNIKCSPFLFVHMALNIKYIQEYVSVYALYGVFWYKWHFSSQVSEVISQLWSVLLNYQWTYLDQLRWLGIIKIKFPALG